MAGDDRLSKSQRREQARAERRAAEIAAAKRARRQRILTIVTTLLVVGGLVWFFVATRDPAPVVNEMIDPAAAELAFEDAGCEVQDIPDQGGGHLTTPAPGADVLYPIRPTHSGQHLDSPSPAGVYENPVDERRTTHSLEHGAVVVWYVEGDATGVGAAEAWGRDRRRVGFDADNGGGIIVSPFADETSSGKPWALRAWLFAVDCDAFDPLVADAILIGHYGTRGQGPESTVSQYPPGVLEFAEAPSPGSSGSDDPSESGSPAPSESVPATPPSEEPSPAGSS